MSAADPRGDADAARSLAKELVSVLDIPARAAAILDAAEKTYSPDRKHSLPGTETERDEPASDTTSSDRLLDTLWVVCVLLVHVLVFPLVFGAIAVATAILAMLCWVMVDRWIGVPVLSVAAVCLGVLASVDTPGTVVRSFRSMKNKCPW